MKWIYNQIKDRDVTVYDSVMELKTQFIDVLNSIPREEIQVNHFFGGNNFRIPISLIHQNDESGQVEPRCTPIFSVNWREFSSKLDYDRREPTKFLTVQCK